MPLYNGPDQQAECQRSGKKCRASELVRDGRNPGLLVLPEWADPWDPLEHPYLPDAEEGKASFPLSPENMPNPAFTLAGVYSTTLTLNWTVAQLIGPRAETYVLYKATNGSAYSVLYTYALDYTNATGHVANIGVKKDYGHIYYVQQSQNDPNSGVILAADQYFSNVVLLAHCDGLNAAQTFPDSSSYNHTCTTVNAGPTNNTAIAKFGTASAVCGATVGAANGVARYNPTGTEFNLTSDFTIEGQMYMPSAILGSNTPVISLKTAANATVGNISMATTGGNFKLLFSLIPNNLASMAPAGFVAFTPDAWHSFTLVLSGKIASLYVDGALSSTGTFASTATFDAVSRVEFGGDNAASIFYQGYLDEIRFTNGVARYTGAYTPPTIAFPDLSAFDPYFASVSWLTHLDGALTDSSPYNRAPTLTGNPALTGAQFKFGTGSLAFTGGVGNYVSAPIVAGAELDLSSGDFTIELWVNRPALGGGDYLIYTGDATGKKGFYMNLTNTQISAGFDDGSGTYLDTVLPLGGITAGAWNHVVLQRRANVYDLYVNGTRGTPASTATVHPAGTQFRFGGSVAAFGGPSLNGYMDEIRVTKGVARYTGNFPPPTAPFSTTTVPPTVYTYYIAAVDSLGDAVATTNVLTLTVTGTGVIT